ncbi:MAG: pantetheine-phosphate adenylyltransferase [Alphaproteobacteria bacterium]
MKALYPGTFDPLTNGHLDIVGRASRMFEEVVVAVSDHGRKNTLFGLKERCQMIEEACAGMKNVRVVAFDNLAVTCAKLHQCKAIIRGLRMTSDFEYEFTMAKYMAEQDAEIQPVYLMADAKLTHISSTSVKEIAKLGGDIAAYVPPHILAHLQEKIARVL